MNERTQAWQKRFTTDNLAWRALLPGTMAILIYLAVARVLMAPYALKSMAKVVLFLSIPYFCLRFDQFDIGRKLNKLFRVKKKERLVLLQILLAGAGIIVAANLLAKPLITAFGITGIVSEIKARAHTTTRVFISALVHIPLVNALVEELFFRGFLFMHVYEQGYPRAAMLGSASLFAIYHLAMFRSWFPWPVLIMIMAALFLVGILLNYVLLKWRRIVMVWLLHGLANLAILLLAWRVF
jgi:membrane protease YdiL (CAAX protease family)